ncbi:interaptin-like [Pomacea canaliculata]|uniref:interaptin-like n=1 Tax=Pomacea canaliculata TaxID=400727 RepID=UPI000D730B8F|nr:interaptin-like [Pomacea canaliculata]
MSVLQVYLSWVNSVLRESSRPVDNVAALQDGRIMCELIDALAPNADLVAKAQGSGSSQQQVYIQMVLNHMKENDIKVTVSAQDVIDGDIKSILDLMWLLILNYGVHSIGQNAYQRSVGIGKRNLLEWCQKELEVAFDHRNTLTLNLCTGNWFIKLLHKFAGYHIQESEDKVSYLYKLLEEIEERYGIRRTIISSNDIVDGTVDEHALMIYLSLLKKRVYSAGRQSRREMFSVDGKEAAMSRIQERNRSLSSEAEQSRKQMDDMSSPEREDTSDRVSSRDNSLSPPPLKENIPSQSLDSAETSDWLSSSPNSLVETKDRVAANKHSSSLQADAEQVLQQTIKRTSQAALSTVRQR